MGSYKPLTGKAKQAASLSTARMNIFEGAVRSAKTIATILIWIHFVRNAPDGNLVMVGKTERTLKRNVIDVMIQMLGSDRCYYNQGEGELWLLGRRIYVAGANDERAQEKIRGLTLVGAYVDEVSVIPKSFWDMLGTRLSVPGAKLFGTSNPDSPTHWLKTVLDEAKLWLTADGSIVENDDGRDLHRMSFTLDDNPHLSDAYKTALKKEYSGLWYRRFILGEWAIAEGSIFDMWDPDKHVVDQLPKMQRCIGVGVDHGTKNPFAAVALSLSFPTDDQPASLYVTSEWRWDSGKKQRQLTNVEYSTRMRDWMTDQKIHPSWIYVDPSAADFKQQLYADNVTNIADAVNDVIPGLQTVSSLLATKRLFVHESCDGLITEFPAYVWDEKAAKKGQDKPLKIGDHSLDALRYVTHSSVYDWSLDVTHETQLEAA